jgi:hypothetical protein
VTAGLLRVAGSFDHVVLAYDLAHLTDRDYETLAAAAATTGSAMPEGH